MTETIHGIVSCCRSPAADVEHTLMKNLVIEGLKAAVRHARGDKSQARSSIALVEQQEGGKGSDMRGRNDKDHQVPK